jgi:hypothetical protein
MQHVVMLHIVMLHIVMLHIVMLHIVMLHIGYRQTKPHIGWMLFENDIQTVNGQAVVVQINSAPGVELGANGQPGSMAIWEHLDVTHETAHCARGECPKFSTLEHYQSRLPLASCGDLPIEAPAQIVGRSLFA